MPVAMVPGFWCPLLLGVVPAEHVCLVKYFCIMISTKPWHVVMASTNVVTLSIEALCSFSVKLWLIYISHGAVPLSHAFCLLVFLFIALEGCCGLYFGNFPKWESGSSWKQESRNTGSVVKKERSGKLLILFIFIQFLPGAGYVWFWFYFFQMEFCNL